RSDNLPLVKNLTSAAGKYLEVFSKSPKISALQEEIARGLALIVDEARWRENLELGACVACSKTDLKCVLPILQCTVCNDVIGEGDEYCVTVGDTNSKERCVAHRLHGVPR
ncbi:unnamed protein product, partial [Ectocarpus sp. 8 AP-2014]